MPFRPSGEDRRRERAPGGRAAGVFCGALLLAGCSLGESSGPIVEPPPGATLPEVRHAAAPPASSAGHPDRLAAELEAMLQQVEMVAEVRVLARAGRRGTIGTAQVPALWTDVEFEVRRVVRARRPLAEGARLKLSFLGGQVGEEVMALAESPSFAVGEVLLLFFNPEDEPFPTFGGTRGVFRVNAAREVLTHEGQPLVAGPPGRISVGPRPESRAPLPLPLGSAAVAEIDRGPALRPVRVEELVERMGAADWPASRGGR